MKISKEEIKMFGDKRGNIDLLALVVYRFAKARSQQNDKLLREEWLYLLKILLEK